MRNANEFFAKKLSEIRERSQAAAGNVVPIEHARSLTGDPLLDEARRRSLEEAAEERRASQQRRLQRQCEASGIPARHAEATFDGYHASDEPQRKALETCRRFGENFRRARDEGANLLLLGSPGTGKTHLAVAILRTVLASGMTAVYVTEADLLRKLRSTYQRDADTREGDAIAAFCAPDLLVIDECGVAIGNPETRRAMLHDIVNGRYEAKHPTLLASNLSEAELARYLGPRAWDRLTDAQSGLIQFRWHSWRQRRGGTA